MISILMATLNPNTEWFRSALDSIQRQTFRKYELVLVDDGTTNCCIEDILAQYSFKYKIIKNDISHGLPYALNLGLKHCEGEFVARMDDDDIMADDRLEKQYQFLKGKNGVVFSGYFRIDGRGNIIDCGLYEKLDVKKIFKEERELPGTWHFIYQKSIIIRVWGI